MTAIDSNSGMVEVGLIVAHVSRIFNGSFIFVGVIWRVGGIGFKGRLPGVELGAFGFAKNLKVYELVSISRLRDVNHLLRIEYRAIRRDLCAAASAAR